MTVANILRIGSGEYKELFFVLFPHLTTVPARPLMEDHNPININ